MQINRRVLEALEPPIAEAQAWVAKRRFSPERPLIDLAQAVPGYPPAAELVAHLQMLLPEAETARYTPIAGLPALRAALAEETARLYGGTVAPDDVVVTAGCNQAFCLAIAALAGPGDEVILPAPYYFNHKMWLDMQGIRALVLPFDPAARGQVDPAALAAAISPRTRAIALVSPSNPSGAVLAPETLDAAFDLARERGIALVLDETYRDFLPPGSVPHHLFSRSDWGETVVQLYSFSKVYSLAGYRVGALVGGPGLVRAATKVMDTVAICAPRIGQEAALFGLRHLHGWREARRDDMLARLRALETAFAGRPGGFELISAGAFFALVRHPHAGLTPAAVAEDLVDRAALLTLPGSMFGLGDAPLLRLAFGNVEAPVLARGIARLEAADGPRSAVR